MTKLKEGYTENISELTARLRTGASFDLVERHLEIGKRDMCFYFIDGFVKDGEMQRVMQYLLSLKELGSAEDILKKLPYVEVELECEVERIVTAVLSGVTAILGETFLGKAILVDLRTYPARGTEEPGSDRVMQGSRDGFVETLVMNTALIRRRIRDTRLTMHHIGIGGSSKTDVVVCYMNGVANEKYVKEIISRLEAIRPKTVALGYQSIAESLIRRGWYNPFPKIRTTERPDTAAAQVMEGSVLVICDTSPQVMILPTSIFDYLQ